MAGVVHFHQNSSKISDAELEPEKSKPILLIESLRPLWKMTEFTGIPLEWGGNDAIAVIFVDQYCKVSSKHLGYLDWIRFHLPLCNFHGLSNSKRG